jgi:DNA-binding NtrC family response regulator
MPPLRERREDIALLSTHLLNKVAKEMELNTEIKLSAEAMEYLCNYDWPGNIRELNNVLERALIYLEGDLITSVCLPAQLKKSKTCKNKEMLGSMEEYEKLVIIQAISKNRGNISKSAEELGIARSTLYQKMDKLSIAH